MEMVSVSRIKFLFYHLDVQLNIVQGFIIVVFSLYTERNVTRIVRIFDNHYNISFVKYEIVKIVKWAYVNKCLCRLTPVFCFTTPQLVVYSSALIQGHQQTHEEGID